MGQYNDPMPGLADFGASRISTLVA
jgi:hypothetical protein